MTNALNATSALTVSLLVSTSGVAFAQAAPSSPDSSAQIAEIVVTAQKHAESVNDVGMSISAISGADLAARDITDTSDLARVIPGFTYTETNYGTPVYTLRGVGFYESSLAASPAVSVYEDEIPLPYSPMTRGAALDLERVEVLKGPQGTSFGQNSTGGAINYIAAKPTRDFQVGMEAEAGTFQLAHVTAYISGQLTDTLRARLAVSDEYRGDWQYSITRDDQLGQKRFSSARLLLDWAPTDALTLLLNVNGWKDHSDTQAVQATSVIPLQPALASPALLATPLAPGNDRAADWTPTPEPALRNEFYQVALRGEYALSSTLRLISISSYENYKENQLTDSDGSALQLSGIGQQGYIRSVSQELRLQGDTEPVRWMVGGNYGEDKISDTSQIFFGDSSNSGIIPGIALFQNRFQTYQNPRTLAAFATANYRTTDHLEFEGGLRYTSVKRNFNGCLGDAGDGRWAMAFGILSSLLSGQNVTVPAGGCTTFNSAFLPTDVVSSLDEHNTSWRAGINYHLDADTLTYFNVNQGFKAGSFSNVGATFESQYAPAKQEELRAFEAGIKASLLARRMQLNATAFYYDYMNKQFRGRVLDPIFNSLEKLVNIPKSRVEGGELQLTWRITPHLTLNSSFTYLDTRVTSSFGNFTPVATPANFEGESFPYSPKWSFVGGPTYDIPISTGINLLVGTDVTYQSRTTGAFGDMPIFDIAPYTLLDTRIGIHAADDKWALTAWVRNVTDKYYWTGAQYLGDTTYRATGMPRTAGIKLNYRFR